MKLNFLPYPKGNRDEWITKKEFERLSRPFLNTEEIKDKDQLDKNIQGLRDYAKKFTNKGGEKSNNAKKNA